MGGRVYDPRLKHFLSPDPSVQAPLYGPSWNRYGYAWNNPSNLVDPSGFGVGDDDGPDIDPSTIDTSSTDSTTITIDISVGGLVPDNIGGLRALSGTSPAQPNQAVGATGTDPAQGQGGGFVIGAVEGGPDEGGIDRLGERLTEQELASTRTPFGGAAAAVKRWLTSKGTVAVFEAYARWKQWTKDPQRAREAELGELARRKRERAQDNERVAKTDKDRLPRGSPPEIDPADAPDGDWSLADDDTLDPSQQRCTLPDNFSPVPGFAPEAPSIPRSHVPIEDRLRRPRTPLVPPLLPLPPIHPPGLAPPPEVLLPGFVGDVVVVALVLL